MSSDFYKDRVLPLLYSSQLPVAPSTLVACNGMCSVIYEIKVNFLEHFSFYKGLFMVFNSNLYTETSVVFNPLLQLNAGLE